MKDAIPAKKVAYMASQQSRIFFAFAVGRCAKMRSAYGEKAQNAVLGEIRT